MWIRGCGSTPKFHGSALLVEEQLENRVPELRHEEADRLGEEALHELIRHALQVPEPAGQKVQQLKKMKAETMKFLADLAVIRKTSKRSHTFEFGKGRIHIWEAIRLSVFTLK